MAGHKIQWLMDLLREAEGHVDEERLEIADLVLVTHAHADHCR